MVVYVVYRRSRLTRYVVYRRRGHKLAPSSKSTVFNFDSVQ